MHIYPYILVKATDEEEAKSKVYSFIYDLTEKHIIDYGEVCKVDKLADVIEKVKEAKAQNMRELDEALKKIPEAIEKFKSDYKSAIAYELGSTLRTAGDLLMESMCHDNLIYNIDDYEGYNYYIPEDYTGWYAVLIDYHI
jgi:predicted RND superfamily exporter protein